MRNSGEWHVQKVYPVKFIMESCLSKITLRWHPARAVNAGVILRKKLLIFKNVKAEDMPTKN